MWNGKSKAVTFSFDDGVTQDIKVIELLNKYNIKGTFNLNSMLLGINGKLTVGNTIVAHNKVNRSKVKEIYSGHEVAAHTLVHPNLTNLDEETIIYQVERDRIELSSLVDYDVVGMAYPCGGVNNNDRVAEIIKNNTGIKYCRTITSTKNYDLQDNYFRFNPTVHYSEEDFEQLVDNFLEMESLEPKLLYIWGHSYELDSEYISWEKFERIIKKLSGKNDIFYGTNSQVFDIK